MSEIKVDTLTGKTTANDITVTAGATATMSLEQGLAKAWVNFNGTGTIAARDSFNNSSLTDSGTGSYVVVLTNSFSSINYVGLGQSNQASDTDDNLNESTMPSSFAAGQYNLSTGIVSTNSRVDHSFIRSAAHGDLA